MGKIVRTKPSITPKRYGALCDECPIQHPTPVGFELNRGAKLTIVCESPGRTELVTGVPLTGPTGRWFDYVCRQTGIARTDLNILNSTCCPMPKNFLWGDRAKMVKCCAPVLAHFMKKAKPKVAMVCGQGASKALLGDHKITSLVGEWRKGTGDYRGIHVLPNFHPTFAGLRKRTLRIHFTTWLRRAFTASKTRVPRWSWSRCTIGATPAAEEALTRILGRNRPIAVDVESVGLNPVCCRVTWVGVADGLESVSIPWQTAKSSHYGCTKSLVSYGDIGNRLFTLMIRVLKEAPYLVTQNGSHDVLALKPWVKLSNGFDTLRAFSAAAPQTQGYRDLESLAVLEFDGVPRWKRDHRATKFRTEEEVAIYNARDADATIRLEPLIRQRLTKTHKGEEIYQRLMAQDEVATLSRELGCLIDTKQVAVHKQKLSTRAYEETRNLKRVAARYDMFNFNPESSTQRRVLFFEKLGARPSVYSEKTGKPSLNDKALSKLLCDPDKEVQRAALHMRRFRGYSQLRKILKSIKLDDNGVLRAEPNVDGTVGERWSYRDPNIQTIPKPKEERQADGSKRVLAAGLRDIFIARPGRVIVELDFARLELYVVGVLSRDPIIKEWMVSDVDAHTENAKAIFGTCDSGLRHLAKIAIYNINYSSLHIENAAKGLFETLKAEYPNITYPKVLYIFEQWFKVHHWIATWRQEQWERAQKLGYTEEPVSGRRRYWYGEPKDTEVFNFPIQTLAGHLTARAVIEVGKHLNWEREGLLFQCHDSLVMEGDDPVRLYKMGKAAMEASVNIYGEEFSFPVDVKIGHDWGNAKEVKGEEGILEWVKSHPHPKHRSSRP